MLFEMKKDFDFSILIRIVAVRSNDEHRQSPMKSETFRPEKSGRFVCITSICFPLLYSETLLRHDERADVQVCIGLTLSGVLVRTLAFIDSLLLRLAVAERMLLGII